MTGPKPHDRAPSLTRGRIERAALTLFAGRGVDGTSMRDIAKAVGVTEGALYRHFASKDDLARLLFLTRYGALAEGISEIGRTPGAFADRIGALVAFFAKAFDDDRDAFAYVLLTQHRHLADLDRTAPENAVEALTQVFRDARTAGDVAPDADVDLLAAMALGLVLQPAIFHLYGRLAGPPSAHAGDIADAVLRMMGAKPIVGPPAAVL